MGGTTAGGCDGYEGLMVGRGCMGPAGGPEDCGVYEGLIGGLGCIGPTEGAGGTEGAGVGTERAGGPAPQV